MKKLPAGTIQKIYWGAGAIAGIFFLFYIIAAFSYLPRCSTLRASCMEHRKAGCSIDGVYPVAVLGRQQDVQCDMKTDGGGWTLIGNYLHKAGADSSQKPVAIPDHLPIFSGKSLGQSDYGTDSWGHAQPVLLEKMAIKEIRFNCASSGHRRNLDFEVTESPCLHYLLTGKGRCIGGDVTAQSFQQSLRNLPGHNAYLPGYATNGFADQGPQALTQFPFFRDWSYHWVLGSADDRWDCDDFDQKKLNSTWHRIWAR